MKPKERKYLRSIYHHFDDLHIRYTNTPDVVELRLEWRKYKLFTKLIYLVLTMDDDQSKDELDRLFVEHNIKTLE